MKLTSKIVMAFAVLAVASTAHAAIIGGISFNGDYTPQTNASVPVSDLNLAQQIAFGSTAVNTFGGRSGDFLLIPASNPVTMFTPLVFSPATIPPAASPLWTTTDGTDTFSFFMTSFTAAPVDTNGNVQSIKLEGSGLITYSGPAGLTPTTGTWVATFTNGASTFSWASSTAANVPDGGGSVALLGLSLLGLGGVSRFVRRK